MAAMFVNGSGRTSNLYRGPSKDASYQVSIHLAKRLQRRRFFQKSTNQKQELLDEMSNLYTGHDIDASYQVSVHLVKRFSVEKIKKNLPIRNNNCLWWLCLLMDRDKMSIIQRGPSIDASYQVSLHLAEGFQRRRLKCKKLSDDRRRTPSDGKSSYCLWQGELSGLIRGVVSLNEGNLVVFYYLSESSDSSGQINGMASLEGEILVFDYI